MEAIIAILVEAILAPIFALFGAMASLVAAIVSSVLTLIGNVAAAFSAPKDRPTRESPARSLSDAPTGVPSEATKDAPVGRRTSDRLQRSRWFRWLTVVVLSLTGMLVITLTVINIWFLDDVVRSLLHRQHQRTGIVITAEHISGNLFTGRFQAEGVTVLRRDHPAGLIDLTIGRVETQIAVWRVLANPRVVESLSITQVRGQFERGVPGTRPETKPWTIGGVEIIIAKDAITIDDRKRRERRLFRVNTLDLRDVDIVYADHTRKTSLVVPVTLTALTAAPLRSDWAVFDVLFRSNASGTIAGSPLTITTSGDDLGRETQWHIDALPVAVLAAQIGGPFSLLLEGTADVRVVDRWQRSDDDRVIVMDWSLMLHDVHAAMPDSPSPLMMLFGKPAVAYLNGQSASIPLSFQGAIDEQRFHGVTSAEAAGMWQVIADSVVATLGEQLDIDPVALRPTGGAVFDAAKEVLDRWRQKR